MVQAKLTTSKGILTLYSAFVFVIMEPAWFSQFPALDKAFLVCKLLLLGLAVIYYFRHRISNFLYLVVFYGFALFMNTVAHDGAYTTALSILVNSTCFVAVTSAMFESHGREAFKSFLFVFELLIVCNLITVIYAPHGLYRLVQDSGWWTDACWFLGLRNGMTPTYVLAAMLEYANVVRANDKRPALARCIVFMLLATFSVYLISQSTAMISATSSSGGLMTIWVLVLACPLVGRIVPLRKVLTFKTAVIANFAIAFLLVVVRFQNLFSYIIVDVLGKDLTLTNRTFIWDNALRAIHDNFLFGFGVEKGVDMSFRLNSLAAVNTTQNGWLDVLYVGGIVLFVVLIGIFAYAIRLVSKSGCSDNTSFLIGYISFVYLMSGQTESLVGARFFLFLALVICLARFLSSREPVIETMRTRVQAGRASRNNTVWRYNRK